jgi:4'-phosphopantetheinyl transferase
MKDANRNYLGRHVVVRVVRVSDGKRWLESSEALLNEEDKRRVGRFRFPEDRARFILGRMLLKETLQEMGMNPGLPLRLTLTSRGRPVLEGEPQVHFSLSHSGDMVGMALTLQGSVGIDLELISRQIKLDSLADRIFSTADLRLFQELDAKEKTAAFFRAWTGKEAVLKAGGLGIAEGLKKISIPLHFADSSSPQLLPPDSGNPGWCLQALPLPEDYMGQVAWDDPEKCLDFRVLNPTAT